MRQRFRKVSADVREEDKLCHKTSVALDYLLRYKHFSYILEALKNLGEAAWRLISSALIGAFSQISYIYVLIYVKHHLNLMREKMFLDTR